MHFIHFTPQDTTNTRFPGFAQLNTRNPTGFFFWKRLFTLLFLSMLLSTRSASSKTASRACFLLCFHCIVAPLGALPTRPTTASKLSFVLNIFNRCLVFFEVIFNVGLLAVLAASSLGCRLVCFLPPRTSCDFLREWASLLAPKPNVMKWTLPHGWGAPTGAYKRGRAALVGPIHWNKCNYKLRTTNKYPCYRIRDTQSL